MAVTVTANWVAHYYDFNYTGNEQIFTAPWTGYYKLEVWGAQGGNSIIPSYSVTKTGGYGGYSTGIIYYNKDGKLYITVGGGGNTATKNCSFTVVGSGFNGGGQASLQTSSTCQLWAGGGGGATHIATVSGLLKNLSSYRNTGGTNISKEILIVAGGGGSSTGSEAHSDANKETGSSANGGNGGGINGNSGSLPVRPGYTAGGGGSQTGAGSSYITTYNPATNPGFGQGCVAQSSYDSGLGVSGGGGWYGGGCGSHSGGGGGSGYIGSSNLLSGAGITKHMTCYSCTTSTATNTRTQSNTTTPTSAPTADVARIGNGYARITWMGDTL